MTDQGQVVERSVSELDRVDTVVNLAGETTLLWLVHR
jgi:hypothetical protein